MILITGGTGLVGGHLLIKLWMTGHRLRATRRPHSQYKELQWIASYYKIDWDSFYGSVEWVTADMLNVDSLREAMTGVDRVFHCAAVVAFHPDFVDQMMQTNIEGTRNMCEVALSAGVKSFGMVSSIAAIADSGDGAEATEDGGTERSGGSNYSITKSRSERIVWEYIERGLPAFMVNPGVILGVGLPNKGSLKLVNSIFQFMPFYTSGGTGYVDVEDVCHALMLCSDRGVVGERYILVSGNRTYRQLFVQLARFMRVAPPFVCASNRVLQVGVGIAWLFHWMSGKPQMLTKETVRSSQELKRYSSGKIERELGFRFIELDETLRKSAEWCLKYHSIRKKVFFKSIIRKEGN